MPRHILKVNELNFPDDYFQMSKEDRDIICGLLLDELMELTIQSIRPELDEREVLGLVIDNTIDELERMERYEICGVLRDVRNKMNEIGN